MSVDALQLLAATDPPKRLLIDDETLKEVAAYCPALLSRIQTPGAGRDKFALGIMASFNRIHIAFEANGHADVLRDITDDMMSDVDALLANSPRELDYVFQELPLLMDMMEEASKAEAKSEASGGIVLTYVTVARHLIDSRVTSAVDDLGVDDAEVVGGSPFMDPTDGSNQEEEVIEVPQARTQHERPGYSPDIKDVVRKLVDAGVTMGDIKITPHISGGDVTFSIGGPLPDLSFEAIAKINAMFMKATGKGVHLYSNAPVNFSFQV